MADEGVYPKPRGVSMGVCMALVKSLPLSELRIDPGLKQSSKSSRDKRTVGETEAKRVGQIYDSLSPDPAGLLTSFPAGSAHSCSGGN